MKVKVTIIVGQSDRSKNFEDDNYFRYLVTDGYFLPSKYITVKDEKQTLKELHEEYLNVFYDWVNVNLTAFRKTKIDECEVVYSYNIPPMINAEKKGKFISQNQKIDLDDFYGEILSTRSRPGFFWS